MNTLSKISLSALFIFSLVACDKASYQPEVASNTTPTQTETNSSGKEAKQDKAGEQDYKMLIEWQNTQEKVLNDAIKNATDKLTEKQRADTKLMQETVNTALLAQIEAIKESAQTLNIEHPEVKALKSKTLEVLTLGAQMIVESTNVGKKPTQEAHKAFGELQAKLNQIAKEGQELENKLREKYTPAQ